MRLRQVLGAVGVLGWITGLLVGSALLRLGGYVDIAHAESAAPAQVGLDEPVLAALREREERIVAREAALLDREQAITLAGRQIEEQITALTDAEQSLADMIAMAETAAAGDLAKLTVVYENMKPADAAQLFENMDPAFSAGFMALMRLEAAAAIMGGLTPATAYAISVILAGRNAATPTE